jgi:hypothetical protein
LIKSIFCKTQYLLRFELRFAYIFTISKSSIEIHIAKISKKMEVQVLSKEVKDIIRGDVFLQAELCGFHKVSVQTIMLWLRNDPEQMVSVNTLSIIRAWPTITNDTQLTTIMQPAEAV